MTVQLPDAEWAKLVEDARDDVDLIELIGGDTSLTPTSPTLAEWAGHCPFCRGTHNGDGFVVRRHGTATLPPGWFCRKCGANGTAIDYVMRREGLDFQGAVLSLTGHPDAPVPLSAPRALFRPVREAEVDRAAALAERHAALAEFYERDVSRLRDRLRDQQAALDALSAEGISGLAVDHFRFGFTDYRDLPSLVLPYVYHTPHGERVVRAIQYRAMFGSRYPDARNGHRYELARGSNGKAIFNADAILHPSDSWVMLVEGAKKVAALWSHGVESVAGLLSKSGWSPDYARWVRKFDRVYVALDPDATDEATDIARSIGDAARVVRLPQKPDDLLVATGGDVDLLWRYVQFARPA